MSVYRITGDKHILQEKSDDLIFIVDPEETVLRGYIDYPYDQVYLFQMTDGVKYIEMDFFVQGIEKFRIVSKDTGEIIVESKAFINDREDTISCPAFEDFCYDYNDNPAEAIEMLRNGEYDEMEII